MSRYTLHGSAALDERIDRDLARIRERAEAHADAGILLGGYGRGEGTPFVQPDGTEVPFNDYDLVVVVNRCTRAVRDTFRRLEAELSEELGIPIDLYPYARGSLPHREFSMLNAELKHGHRVIWGDPDILDALPAYPLDALPKTEGTRLLLNRGKLLLDLRERLENETPLSADETLRFVKFLHKIRLALGDAALLDAGQYGLSYAEKAERIDTIGDCPERAAVIEGYHRALAFKHRASTPEDVDLPAECEAMRILFLAFFNWYRERHRARECGLLKAALLNLRWNGRPLLRHPRFYLYEALQELLQASWDSEALRQCLFSPADPVARFRRLHRRFS